jgi:hypothetical protein
LAWPLLLGRFSVARSLYPSAFPPCLVSSTNTSPARGAGRRNPSHGPATPIPVGGNRGFSPATGHRPPPPETPDGLGLGGDTLPRGWLFWPRTFGLSLNQRGGARRAQMAATAARVKLVHWVVKRSLAETSSLLSTLCDLSPA